MNTTTTLRHGLVLATALLAGSFVNGAARADEVRSARVSIADLDLTKPAGFETLHARLRVAANVVCGDAAPADVRGKGHVRQCRAAAIERAIRDLDNPSFAAWYAAKTGESTTSMRLAAR